MKDPETIPILEYALNTEKSDWIRAEIVRTLASFNSSQTTPILLKFVLGKADSPNDREYPWSPAIDEEAECNALIAMQGTDVMESVAAKVRDGTMSASHAIWFAERMNDKNIVPIITRIRNEIANSDQRWRLSRGLFAAGVRNAELATDYLNHDLWYDELVACLVLNRVRTPCRFCWNAQRMFVSFHTFPKLKVAAA
jgi:hypothetical protein